VLYDLQGRIVRAETAIATQLYDFDRQALPAGAYLYKILTNGNLPKVGKLILE
jgi:hypothetical protein